MYLMNMSIIYDYRPKSSSIWYLARIALAIVLSLCIVIAIVRFIFIAGSRKQTALLHYQGRAVFVS